METSEKITPELAEMEVNKWLDFKKISPSKRISKKDAIKGLINGLVDGDLVIAEDMKIVQTLKIPIGHEGKIKELEFKARINIGAVQHHLQKVDSSDADGRVVCYVQALTGQPAAMIKSMDSVDYDVAQTIALFFI